MSPPRSNVELLHALLPSPDMDVAALLRDDKTFAAMAETLEDVLHPDIESVPAWRGTGITYSGINGFREMWLDWLEPWISYRVEVDEMVELGDRIVVFVRDHGRRHGTDVDVELISGSIWTFRNGRIARVEFYRNREELREAAGFQ